MQGMIEEGKFDDQVIGSTVKAGLVDLVRAPMNQGQMRVGVMGRQGMDRDLWRDAEGEECQQEAGQ